MSNLGAFISVVLPLGLVLYVIRGSLVSREAYAQEREKVRRVKEENAALTRYTRALLRNQEASQPGVQWVSEGEFEERRQRVLEALRNNHFSETLSRQMAEAMRPPVERDWIEERSLGGTVHRIPVSPPPWAPMPVIQPYNDYPFPATQPPEDQ